jgi:hypothetical protein
MLLGYHNKLTTKKNQMRHNFCILIMVLFSIKAYSQNDEIPSEKLNLDSIYSSVKIDSTNVMKYLKLSKHATKSTYKLIDEYFSKQPEETMFTRTSWNIIRDYVDDYRNKYFRFLLNNEQAYIDLYSKDSVNNIRYYI